MIMSHLLPGRPAASAALSSKKLVTPLKIPFSQPSPEKAYGQAAPQSSLSQNSPLLWLSSAALLHLFSPFKSLQSSSLFIPCIHSSYFSCSASAPLHSSPAPVMFPCPGNSQLQRFLLFYRRLFFIVMIKGAVSFHVPPCPLVRAEVRVSCTMHEAELFNY